MCMYIYTNTCARSSDHSERPPLRLSESALDTTRREVLKGNRTINPFCELILIINSRVIAVRYMRVELFYATMIVVPPEFHECVILLFERMSLIYVIRNSWSILKICNQV